MLFNSFEFLIFLPTVVILYYITKPAFRWLLLLVASYYFKSVYFEEVGKMRNGLRKGLTAEELLIFHWHASRWFVGNIQKTNKTLSYLLTGGLSSCGLASGLLGAGHGWCLLTTNVDWKLCEGEMSLSLLFSFRCSSVRRCSARAPKSRRGCGRTSQTVQYQET